MSLNIQKKQKKLAFLILLPLILSCFLSIAQIPIVSAEVEYAGYTTIAGSSSATKNAATLYLCRIQVTTTGEFHGSAYLGFTSGNFKLFVFADNAGDPSDLLYTSAVGTYVESPSLRNVSFTGTITPAYYWLGIMADTFYDVYEVGSGTSRYVDSLTYPTPPDPITTSTSVGSKPVIYLTITSEESSPVSANPAYDYTLAQNSSGYYVLNSTEAILYSNVDGATAFNYLDSLGNDKTFYINASISLSETAFISNIENCTYVFDSSSLFTLTDSMPNPIYDVGPAGILVVNCVDVAVVDASVTGAGSGGNAHEEGILIYNSTNCYVAGATIYNLKMFGFTVWDSVQRDSNCGIYNSTIYQCGWNGMQLGIDNTNYTLNAFAIGNTVYDCSDVGITSYGLNAVISNNTVYNIMGADGGGGNAHVGIAVEEGAFATITNNVVSDSNVGVSLGQGSTIHTNIARLNTIDNCTTGILVQGTVGGSTANFNVIVENTITNWASNYDGTAIHTQNNAGATIIALNNCTSTKNDSGYGIIASGSNCSIYNNTVTIPVVSDSGIALGFDSFNIVRNNNLQARIGIYIGSGADNNYLYNNDVGNCTYEIQDAGTGNLVDPSSRSTYTLHVSNPFDNSATGVSVYGNTTQRVLTTAGVLNVNGVNVTSPYTFTVDQDYVAYALGASVALTDPSATPTPTPGPVFGNGPGYFNPDSTPDIVPFVDGGGDAVAIAFRTYVVIGVFFLIVFGGVWMVRPQKGRRRKVKWKLY